MARHAFHTVIAGKPDAAAMSRTEHADPGGCSSNQLTMASSTGRSRDSQVDSTAPQAMAQEGRPPTGNLLRDGGATTSLRGMATSDEVLTVAAAHRLGLVRTDQWPMVAAQLIAAGHDGEALIRVAGLPPSASGWEVDQLLPQLLAELDAPDLDIDGAGEVAARLLATSVGGSGHSVIRALAPLAPDLGYPGGRIGQAYQLSEWLDCDCHEGSQERIDADRFEQDVRRLPRLDIPPALAEALTAS